MARRAPQRRKRSSGKKAGKRQKSVWPWLAVMVLAAGGIMAYDNRGMFLPEPQKPQARQVASRNVAVPVAKPKTERPPERPAKVVAPRESVPVPPKMEQPKTTTVASANAVVPISKPGDETLTGRGFAGTFYFCGTSGLDNCVVDGSTFWHRKTRIRIADIDTPATETAKCDTERHLGFSAKVRLKDMLNAGAFELKPSAGDADGRDKKYRLVLRNGRSLGDALVSEGLARKRNGKPQKWC